VNTVTTLTAPSAVVSGLDPYTGPWNHAQAAHLLRRTLFGPKKSEITETIGLGMSNALNQLLADPVPPSPPVNHFFTEDPNVPIGATWIESPNVPGVEVGQYRRPSLRGWYWQNLLHHDFNIMSRMTMFWINHFGMADVSEQRSQYQYINLFNEFGTGNYRTMIEKITVNPGMLEFLGGKDSNQWNPNENYARELLELFTIQKGPAVSQGDYTFYTEDDIVPIARALTGWRIRGSWSTSRGVVESYFYENWHDPDPKQLSYRFDNVVINNTSNGGRDEYKDVIAVIFGKEETARSFCRELYRFFVYYDITPQIENDVIGPLAQVLIAADFEIRPTLRALFGSQHFYDMAVRGPLIKSPYEFTVSMARTLGGFGHLGLDLADNTNSNPQLLTAYQLGLSHHWRNSGMDMDFLYPPTVAGWKAYYQSPGYYRNWIGSATLKQRKKLVNSYTGAGIYTQENNSGDYLPRPFDLFQFVADLDDPYEAAELVAESVRIFLPRELHPNQLYSLKQQLLDGQMDQEWRIQYTDARANPFTSNIVNPVRNRLRKFFRALFSLAEFNLM